MKSAADGLRDDTRRRMAALSPAERLELAFALGEDDVRIYAAANAVSPADAKRRLRASRQIGRRRSCANEETR